jgi:hypothetical protein
VHILFIARRWSLGWLSHTWADGKQAHRSWSNSDGPDGELLTRFISCSELAS